MSTSTRLSPESSPVAERTPGVPMPSREYVEDPDESQRALMATLGITFQDGTYRLGAFEYDRVADAVNYARLQLQSPAPV
jgi:hypothetical protein